MAGGKSSVNVKIDSDIKKLASQLFSRMGMDQTTAIDMFYRQVIAERGLPFRPTAAPTLDECLMAALENTQAHDYELEMDEQGHIIIDKDKQPDLYDWALNG